LKTFYTDTHFCGVNQLTVSMTYGENCFYLGNIVDLKTCLKTEVFQAQDLQAHILKKAGKNYISGNRELCFDNTFIVKDGIYMAHGDFFFWGEEKAKAFRNQEYGLGRISRFFHKIGSHFRMSCGLNKEFCDRVASKAKSQGCHTVVVGHLRPKKMIKKVYKGIIIYVLPTGKTTLPI